MGVGKPLNNNVSSWIAHLYLWATYRLYNEFAWAYDAVSWVVSFGQWSAWRRLALVYVEGSRVLEVGFGTGTLLTEMARCGWCVYGLEPSPAMHRMTARKLKHARMGVDIPRIRATAQGMPFEDGCFDTVVATFPAPYILDPVTLHEVARVLTYPGGRFVIAGLFVETDYAILQRLAPFFFGSPSRDFLTIYERMAAEAGFTLSMMRPESSTRGFRSPVFILELDA